jgi:hypothetical protein
MLKTDGKGCRNYMTKITKENFHAEFEIFFKKNRDMWLMIRPDRPSDPPEHCYPNEDARRRGNAAMKKWFEYLAAKGFISTFNGWRGIIKSGQSVMVVSDDPDAFDSEFVPPIKPVLAADFWDEWLLSHVPVDHRWDALSPNDKERVVKIARDLSRELRMAGAKRAPSPPVRPLREWKSIPLDKIDASKPLPKLSEAALKTLGRMIPEGPE